MVSHCHTQGKSNPHPHTYKLQQTSPVLRNAQVFQEVEVSTSYFPTSSFSFSQMILLISKCVAERTCRLIQGCAHHRKLWLARCGKVAAQVCCHCCSKSDFPESLAINWFQLKTTLISLWWQPCYDHDGQCWKLPLALVLETDTKTTDTASVCLVTVVSQGNDLLHVHKTLAAHRQLNECVSNPKRTVSYLHIKS